MSEYLNNEAEKVLIDNNSAVNNVSILDDKSDLNMIKIQELRNTLEESLNNFYSDRDCHRFLTKHNFNMQKCHEMICQHYQWYLNPVTSWEIENPKLSPRDMGLVEVDSKQNQFNSVYPCSFLGEDREGRPIYWEKMGYSKRVSYLFQFYFLYSFGVNSCSKLGKSEKTFQFRRADGSTYSPTRNNARSMSISKYSSWKNY